MCGGVRGGCLPVFNALAGAQGGQAPAQWQVTQVSGKSLELPHCYWEADHNFQPLYSLVDWRVCWCVLAGLLVGLVALFVGFAALLVGFAGLLVGLVALCVGVVALLVGFAGLLVGFVGPLACVCCSAGGFGGSAGGVGGSAGGFCRACWRVW